MSTEVAVFYGALGGVGWFLLETLIKYVWRLRTPKTTPNHARLVARPGATLDLVTDDGDVVVKVILSNITHASTGTDVLFEDYFRYKRERTYRG